jgi:hypothetical protein
MSLLVRISAFSARRDFYLQETAGLPGIGEPDTGAPDVLPNPGVPDPDPEPGPDPEPAPPVHLPPPDPDPGLPPDPAPSPAPVFRLKPTRELQIPC